MPRKKNPTPEEIEERCKEIQATWSEETRISRIVDPKMLPPNYHIEIPVIKTADLTIDIANYDEPGEFEVNLNFNQEVKMEDDEDEM